MDDRDHVATALRDMEAGEMIRYRDGAGVHEVTLIDPIPFGHKLAIKEIGSEQEVRKYGEVIGVSSTAIAIGRHVHVHNIEGIRGRGDQARKETA
jgi:altronate dehydratase small subunit